MKNSNLGRALRRALRALGATLLSGLGVWLASPEFREFLGGLPYATFALALIPPIVQALDKLRRDLRG